MPVTITAAGEGMDGVVGDGDIGDTMAGTVTIPDIGEADITAMAMDAAVSRIALCVVFVPRPLSPSI